MPGVKTHYFFGQQILADISDDISVECIKKNMGAFNIGLQGPDLFYYNPESWVLYDSNMGNLIHDEQTKAFFAAMLRERDSFHKAYDKAICDAYILGFMAHYTLDCQCHPYIYYRTKHMSHEGRDLYDFGLHVFLETDIDNAVLKSFEHKKPSEFCVWKTVLATPHERAVLTHLLKKSIDRAFPNQHMRASTILSAFRTTPIVHWLMHDPTGLKKMLVRFCEDKFAGYAIVSSMVPADNVKRYKDPCNTAHHKWHNPWDPSLESDQDVYQMMDSASKIMCRRIELYTEAFKDKPHDRHADHQGWMNALLSDIGNKSYCSGLEE